MVSLYIIGKQQPVQLLDKSLNTDYTQYLTTYGEGEVGQFLMVSQPDKDYLRDNFSDDMDLWGLEGEKAETLLNASTVARTIDGDIVVMLTHEFVILPRHSDEPLRLPGFEEVIKHYKLENAVFDPYPDYQQEYINLVQNGSLDKTLVDNIRHKFTQAFLYNKILNEDTQPRYIIQDIGGWVFFDLVYKSAIRVKYQSLYQEKAQEVISWIKDAIGLKE